MQLPDLPEALAYFFLLTLTACVGCAKKTPKECYNEPIGYFRDGISLGWDKVDPEKYGVKEVVRGSAYVTNADGSTASGVTVTTGPSDYRDKSNQFGYLIKDLDGDDTMESLIGLTNDAPQTQFLDLYIWHNDFGPTYNNSFPILGTGSLTNAGKFELTPF